MNTIQNYYFSVNHAFGNFVLVIISEHPENAEKLCEKIAGTTANICNITGKEAESLVNLNGYKVFFNSAISYF
jgi:hypothetical protein